MRQLTEKAGTQFASEVVEVLVAALREERIRVIKGDSSWSQKANIAAPRR